MSADMTFVIAAGEHDRGPCPVRVEIPLAGPVRVHEAESGREALCQVEGKSTGTVLYMMLDALARGASRAYRAVAGEPSPGLAAGFGMADRPGDSVDFQVGGQLFTSYRYGANWARPYFHPVVGPGGKRVTRNYPMEDVPGEMRDHHHHKGIFVAHGDVNGVDDWSEEKGHGRIVHRGFLSLVSGPVFAGAVEELDWVGNDGRRVMAETRRLAVYNVPGDSRLLDVEETFQAVDGPVTFGDTKEGGLLSVRVATSMDGNKGGLIENGSGGRTEHETWGKRAPWCSYSGPVDGERLGIAVFDHTNNPRYPTYWHVRDYGLMTANPFGLSAFFSDPAQNGSLTIPAGQSATFRFRVYVHRGDAADGRVADRWADYAYAPTVTVQ